MMDSPHSLRSLGETQSGPVAFLGLIVNIPLIKERGVVQSEVGACGRDPIDDVWLSDPVLVEDWTLGFLQ